MANFTFKNVSFPPESSILRISVAKLEEMVEFMNPGTFCTDVWAEVTGVVLKSSLADEDAQILLIYIEVEGTSVFIPITDADDCWKPLSQVQVGDVITAMGEVGVDMSKEVAINPCKVSLLKKGNSGLNIPGILGDYLKLETEANLKNNRKKKKKCKSKAKVAAAAREPATTDNATKLDGARSAGELFERL